MTAVWGVGEKNVPEGEQLEGDSTRLAVAEKGEFSFVVVVVGVNAEEIPLINNLPQNHVSSRP